MYFFNGFWFVKDDPDSFAADELPVHYRGGVGKSEKGRVGRWESVSDVGVVIKLVLNFTK